MKKGIAAMLVAKMPKEKKAEEDDVATEEMSDEEVAADDLLEAISGEDPAALVDAFKNLMRVCGYGKDEEEYEEDSEEA